VVNDIVTSDEKLALESSVMCLVDGPSFWTTWLSFLQTLGISME